MVKVHKHPNKYRQLFLHIIISIWFVGFSYVGIVMIFLGPIMTNRGDIDYLDLSRDEQMQAKFEALVVKCIGVVVILIGVAPIVIKRVLVKKR